MCSPHRHGAGCDGVGCTWSVRRRGALLVKKGGHDSDGSVTCWADYDRCSTVPVQRLGLRKIPTYVGIFAARYA